MVVNSEPDLMVVTNDRDTTLTYANLTLSRTGYYRCQSAESEEEFELFTTLGKQSNLHVQERTVCPGILILICL